MKRVFRFAPSPTGYLHVGGARTALFNWLAARRYKGRFLLRIEDTDQQRSTEASINQIFAGMRWLGLGWDEEVYYQSRHVGRHSEIAYTLLENGSAYRCFCTREELEEKRRRAEALKINKRYDGTCRHLTDSQIDQNLRDKKPFVVRFAVPPGPVTYEDTIHGPARVASDTLDDFIILRTDGSPVYQLAVVADDHDMGVTDVLRGDDHITNTSKQILLYRALGWDEPRFGHLPLILGPDKVRLSKRHGATSLSEFQNQGILPEAMFNYLCLLGWSPGDDSEVMLPDEIIDRFDEQRINRNPAVFDEQKLIWINGKHLARKTPGELFGLLESWLRSSGYTCSEDERERLLHFVSLLQIRVQTLVELQESLKLFFEDPQDYEEKGVRKFFRNEDSAELLESLRQGLAAQQDALFVDIDGIETYIRSFAEDRSTSAAKVIHPLRLSLTGQTSSPGIFEMIYILGRKRVLRRLQNARNFIDKLTIRDDR